MHLPDVGTDEKYRREHGPQVSDSNFSTDGSGYLCKEKKKKMKTLELQILRYSHFTSRKLQNVFIHFATRNSSNPNVLPCLDLIAPLYVFQLPSDRFPPFFFFLSSSSREYVKEPG